MTSLAVSAQSPTVTDRQTDRLMGEQTRLSASEVFDILALYKSDYYYYYVLRLQWNEAWCDEDTTDDDGHWMLVFRNSDESDRGQPRRTLSDSVRTRTCSGRKRRRARVLRHRQRKYDTSLYFKPNSITLATSELVRSWNLAYHLAC